jgi:hypothetical protein
VNPRVGSSGTRNGNELISQQPENGLKLFLNGPPVRLPLPAYEIGSVIFKNDLNVSHQLLSSKKKAPVPSGLAILAG